MTRSAADYADLVAAHWPAGDAWPREPGTALSRLWDLVGGELARVDARVIDLLREADPRQAVELLDEWEREVGLPDECSAGLPLLEARRAAVVARLVERLSPTPAALIALAAAYGVEATITEYRPHTTEHTTEDPVTDEAWAHVWTMTSPDRIVLEATTEDTTEVPLVVWSEGPHECAVRRMAPAHTLPLFATYRAEWDFSLGVPAGAALKRASPATLTGSRGDLVEVAADVARHGYDPALIYTGLPDGWFDGETVGAAPTVNLGFSGGGGAWVQTVLEKGITDAGLPYIAIRGQTTPINTSSIAAAVGGRAAATGVPARAGETLAGSVRASIVAMTGVAPTAPLPSLRFYEAAETFLTATAVPIANTLAVGTEYAGTVSRTLTNANARQGVWSVFFGPGAVGVPVDLTVKFVHPVLHRGATPATDLVPPATLAARSGTIPLYGRRGLMIEPAGENRIGASADVASGDGVWWSNAPVGITRATAAGHAPDGTLSWVRLIESAVNEQHGTEHNSVSVDAGEAYSWSIHAKVGTRRFLVMTMTSAGFGSQAYVCFDLQAGVVTQAGTNAVPFLQALPGGGYRVGITSVASATEAAARGFFRLSTTGNGGRAPSYAGDGTSGLFVWGAQFEAGTVSSYVPTAGAAEARAADRLVLDVPDGLYDMEVVATTIAPGGTLYSGQAVASLGFGLPFAWPAAAFAAGERHLRSLTLRKVA